VPQRGPEAGFSHNYNKFFLKKPKCGIFLVLNVNDNIVSEKVTLAVTLKIKKFHQSEDILQEQNPHLT